MSSNTTPVAGENSEDSTEPKLSYKEIIIAGEAALKNLKEEFDPQKVKIWENFIRLLKKYDQDKQSTTSPNIYQCESQHHHRRIGEKLVVCSEEIIAKGSNGTVIFEGTYEGRPVAVKRLLQSHHEVAFKEIKNLIKSDCHQNIVRYHGKERDQDFVYIALERCTCNLDELVQICLADSSPNECVSFYCKRYDPSPSALSILEEDRLKRVKSVLGDFSLIRKENGRPLPSLLKLMREVVRGLVHLHKLGIIHRDLKPQNVLIINEESSLHAKLSDMGISKRLRENKSSLSHHSTGCGTSGWKAPEGLNNGRQTYAMDLFSLGCILFFCITHGRHPFGDDHYERDSNVIKNNIINLFLLDDFPEAQDLISHLLKPNPKLRPRATYVLNHPMLWDSEKRLLFLCEVSNRLGGQNSSLLRTKLDSTARASLAAKYRKVLTWDKKVDENIITYTQPFLKRDYRFGSVGDLLRLIRNLFVHYGQLPEDIKEILGALHEGFDGYFTTRFPKLFMEVYKVVCATANYKEEDCFRKYF